MKENVILKKRAKINLRERAINRAEATIGIELIKRLE